MYGLADLDFSNRLGVVVSELAPEEMDHQDQTLGAKRALCLRSPAACRLTCCMRRELLH